MMKPEYIDVSCLIEDKSILKLFHAVQDYGGALRFVGGAVRDALAGKQGFEIDLATDLTPDELVEACAEKGIKTVSIGLKFAKTGVVINNQILEVSSLHKNVEQTGTLSDFAFTDDWNADASNRDLTINAVYADEFGNVFDYYNGIDDLKKGIVRFIGRADDKVKEQPIRILRFFRFYSLFSKTEPDLKSLKACVENKDLLKKVAVEQIREEFFKILQTPKAALVLEMMRENGVLDFMLPNKLYIEDFALLDKIVTKNHIEPDIVRRLYVLFAPDSALAESLAARFHLTKVQRSKLVTLSRFAFDSIKFDQISYLKKVIFSHGKDFVKDNILIALLKNKRSDYDVKALFDVVDQFEPPLFPLNGKDLIEMGMIDCSPIKEIMAKLKNDWIESGFTLSIDDLREKAKLLIK